MNSFRRSNLRPTPVTPSPLKVFDSFYNVMRRANKHELSRQLCQLFNEDMVLKPLLVKIATEYGNGFLLDKVRRTLEIQLEGGVTTKDGLRYRTPVGAMIEMVKRELPCQTWKKLTKTA